MGEGSTFTIELPAERAPVKREHAAGQAPSCRLRGDAGGRCW